MTTLQIKEVPENIRDTLAAEAKRQGRTMQSLLFELLTEAAGRARNTAILAQFAHRTDGYRSDGSDDTVELIRQARSERDEHLDRLITGGETA